MSITSIATYLPAWGDDRARHLGPDEDVVTLAVAAGRAAVGAETSRAAPPSRIVLLSRTLDVVEGVATGVVTHGIGVGADVPVEVRVGGAPDCLDALATAAPGTLVIAVDVAEPSSAAAAALLGDGPGIDLVVTGRHTGSLPMRVRHVGSGTVSTYQDGRVERDLAWAPLIGRLAGDGEPLVAGVRSADARRLGAAKADAPTTGAASVLFLLAGLADSLPASGTSPRLVALDAATGVAADVAAGSAAPAVLRERRAALPLSTAPSAAVDADIPFSMPAYARAFDAKIGLTAARCECGQLSYPPRALCLNCGRQDATMPAPLPRTGEVYTVVTVHVPVPGLPGPYALAIVSLDDSPVRLLAKVTDAPATATGIGDRGRLVLRRTAVREGVPDYGYAFAPDPFEPQEVAR